MGWVSMKLELAERAQGERTTVQKFADAIVDGQGGNGVLDRSRHLPS
jgi:hypothetical protein